MSDKFMVSQSKVKTWRRCRRAYHYKYVEKIRAKRKSRPLAFGTLIHQMIERDAEGDDWREVITEMDPKQMKLFAQEKEEYGEILNDTRRIMTEYFTYWENDGLNFCRIKGQSAEHEFEVEILPDVIFNGKIDGIGRRNGLRFLIEHKSYKRAPTDDDRWRNLQSVTYFKAMDMLGWKPVDGTCWDYLWSKPPLTPSILKDGSMSKKSVDTLPIAVVEFIEENDLDPDDYADFIKAVEKNRAKWFQRVYTVVNEEVKEFVWDDFVSTVEEMVDGHGKKKDMNIERHCSWCDYEPLCRARMQGLDYDFVKQRQFDRSEGRPESKNVHRKLLT